MNEIPTIPQLYALIIQDFENNMNVSLPPWGKFIIKTYAMINASMFYLLFLKNYFVYKNMLPDTADSVSDGGTLQRFGMLMLNRLPFKATQAQYLVIGTGDPSSTIPANRQFTALRNGVVFSNDVPFVFTNVPTTFNLRSLTAGASTRLFPGDILELVSPVTGVLRQFTVLSEVTEPMDSEPLESYRQKIIQAYRYRSRGGAAKDYRYWASQVVGVRNSYPYTGIPAAGVNLFIESETGNGIPSPALISAVQSYVDIYRPLGIYINYLPVYSSSIDLTIQGAVNITTTDKTLISDAIVDYLKNKRPYVQSTDGSMRNDVINLNEIIALIQTVKPNLALGNISILVNGSNHVSYMLSMGEIPLLTNVNYV